MFSNRYTPQRRQVASKAGQAPARLAVCEAAALAPASLRPDLAMHTGLPAAAARASSAVKRGAFLTPSMYRQTTSVSGSSIRYSKKSFRSMSAWLPTDTALEKPAPTSTPREIMAPISAPLWLARPMPPRGNSVSVPITTPVVAHRLWWAFIRPMQLGPISRTPPARARATRASSSARPSGPVSAKPAVMHSAQPTPLATQSSTAARTCWRGTRRMARSTGPGQSRTDL